MNPHEKIYQPMKWDSLKWSNFPYEKISLWKRLLASWWIKKISFCSILSWLPKSVFNCLQTGVASKVKPHKLENYYYTFITDSDIVAIRLLHFVVGILYIFMTSEIAKYQVRNVQGFSTLRVSPTEFLNDIIDEFAKLVNNPQEFDGATINLSLINDIFVCDNAAKSFIWQTKNHGDFFPVMLALSELLDQH